MTRRIHNYALISCTVNILHVIEDVRFTQGSWNKSLVDRCWRILYRLQTKNWVSVNVNVQGRGIRRRNHKTQSCKLLGHPHATTVALSTISPIHSKQFPRPKHIRGRTESGSWGIYPIGNSIRSLVVRRWITYMYSQCALLCQICENLDTLQHRLVHCRLLWGTCTHCNACFRSSLDTFPLPGTRKKISHPIDGMVMVNAFEFFQKGFLISIGGLFLLAKFRQ